MENTDSERSRVCPSPTWKPEEAGWYQPTRVLGPLSHNFMVSVAVWLLGTTELMFIVFGVKINGVYYCDVLLGDRSIVGDFFT